MALNRHDPATAIPMLEKHIKELEGKSATKEEVKKIIESTSQTMHRLDILTSNGNFLFNSNQTTTLSARVTSWDIDVTDKIDASLFIWTRKSGDDVKDAVWNESHSAGTKELELTIADVGMQSTFHCTVYDTNNIDVEASILVMSDSITEVKEWLDKINPFVYTRYSMNADGNPFYTSPSEMEEPPKYIGVCYSHQETAPTDPASYTWLMFRGNDAPMVISEVQEYYLSTSESSLEGGMWSKTEPEWEDGKYLWTRYEKMWDIPNPTEITYTRPVIATTWNTLHQVAAAAGEAIDNFGIVISETDARYNVRASEIESKVLEQTLEMTALQAKTTELESKVTQTPEAVETRFTEIQRVIDAQGERITEQETLIRKNADGIEISKTDSPSKVQLGNESLDLMVNDVKSAEFGVEGMKSPSVKAVKQYVLGDEWAIRNGATIPGKGKNLNIQWIGG